MARWSKSMFYEAIIINSLSFSGGCIRAVFYSSEHIIVDGVIDQTNFDIFAYFSD